MQIEETGLEGVLILTPKRFGDARGWFAESWNRRTLEEAGLDLPDFVQDNHSLSAEAGTLRGLHYQAPPHAQGKLVRCGRGALWDVAVDARRGQPDLRALDRRRAHGRERAAALDPGGLPARLRHAQADTEVVYKCTDHYAPAADGAVRWDSCGIDWPLRVSRSCRKRTPPRLSSRIGRVRFRERLGAKKSNV